MADFLCSEFFEHLADHTALAVTGGMPCFIVFSRFVHSVPDSFL